MRQLFQTLFFFLLVTQTCFGQWVQSNGLYGVTIWNLAVSGTHLFAATQDSGVFHSTNNGASWVAANTPFGDFSNIVQIGSHIFAGTYSAGVWSSTNNGASWTQVNTGITDTVVRALVVSGTNLVAGTADNGIFLSTDLGTNWTHVDLGLPNAWVFSIVVSGNNLFASTGAGVFLSNNNGINWTRTDSVMQVGQLRANSTNPFIMLTCYDCCPLTSDKSVGRKILNSPLEHYDGNSIVGTEGVYTSNDSGKSWSYLGFYCASPQALEVSDTNLFVGTFGGGVFLSTNNGANWTEVNQGLMNIDVRSLAISGATLFAGTCCGGIWRRPLSEMIPVELTSFTAATNGKEVILNWSTATELNNQLFEVQRSFEGSEFATVGFVSGKGTTTERQDYSYSDEVFINGKYSYRLKQIDYLGSYEYSDVVEVDFRTFSSYLLEQCYPNPFNPTTTIGFGIQNKSNVKITVLNAIGEEVAVVLNEEREAGYHQVEFNAANLPSGVYFYQMKTGSFVETKKMLLLK
jgi:hypothetical protein